MVFDSLTMYEKELIQQGFEYMTVTNQNNLVSALSAKLNLPLFQITMAHILDYHKEIKFRILDESCELGIKNGFTSTTTGHHYRLNDTDQINFLGMAERLSRRPEITTVQWRVEDLEGYFEHTRAEWLAVQDEAFDHKFGQLMKYNVLTTTVKNATNHATIVAVKWENPL
ncbi:hypothetical protein pW2_85 [Bacillus phage pW2]|uniref:DUF4376 domain-containing protein n=1 Tax=Bacillus phage pW2 TaxID=2500559 RepID=A0A3Q9R7E2_9CAUD|nr:tail fiber protein [Bacillus phage pW2]AZU98918.1 hypothetical protein pW2_85 [Bacillus phage pW2]